MLWRKSWLETRSRFLIGLVLLIFSAAGTVFAYPRMMQLMPLADSLPAGGELARRIREGVELAREYRGYVWSQAFRQNLPQMWALFAALLGTGGLLSQASGGGTLFTLSLPVTRARLLGVRAATGLAEILVLAFVPALVLPLLSPAVGETYGLVDAFVHAACLFVAGAVFYSLAFLLSTVFSDVWRPPLIVLGGAVVMATAELIVRDLSRFSLFRVMSAEVYFRGGGLPWPGLVLSAAVSAALLYAATRNIARQDF